MALEFASPTLEDLEAVSGVEVPFFGNEEAVALGLVAIETIKETGANLAVDIRIGDDLVFRAKLGTTGAGNNPWLEGKHVVVTHHGVPSLLVRRRQEAAGDHAVDGEIDGAPAKFVGGSIPILVGGAVVATITMSGEKDYVDHAVNALAVSRWLAA